MTTLENRSNTALLVVDVQNGVVEGAHKRDAVVANVGSLVEKARRERVSVVWVQHSDEQLARGSDDWRIVPELTPGDAEPLVEKNCGDSFEDTTLETVLSGLGVGRLVVVGAQTDAAEHELLAPTLLRSQTLSALHEAVHRGEIPPDVALDRLARIRAMPIRLLGDAVLRRRAWDLAEQLKWAETYDAEYLALTQLQADAFITLDAELARRAEGIVPTATIDALRTA